MYKIPANLKDCVDRDDFPVAELATALGHSPDADTTNVKWPKDAILLDPVHPDKVIKIPGAGTDAKGRPRSWCYNKESLCEHIKNKRAANNPSTGAQLDDSVFNQLKRECAADDLDNTLLIPDIDNWELQWDDIRRATRVRTIEYRAIVGRIYSVYNPAFPHAYLLVPMAENGPIEFRILKNSEDYSDFRENRGLTRNIRSRIERALLEDKIAATFESATDPVLKMMCAKIGGLNVPVYQKLRTPSGPTVIAVSNPSAPGRWMIAKLANGVLQGINYAHYSVFTDMREIDLNLSMFKQYELSPHPSPATPEEIATVAAGLRQLVKSSTEPGVSRRLTAGLIGQVNAVFYLLQREDIRRYGPGGANIDSLTQRTYDMYYEYSYILLNPTVPETAFVAKIGEPTFPVLKRAPAILASSEMGAEFFYDFTIRQRARVSPMPADSARAFQAKLRKQLTDLEKSATEEPSYYDLPLWKAASAMFGGPEGIRRFVSAA